jgi:dolichol-phosphate mannosyltransferase
VADALPPIGAPELSVVVPIYGCGGVVDELSTRIAAAADAAAVSSWELVLVDDRSPDDAWRRILALAAREPRIRGIRLSRNFGQAAAITAGLAEARGALVVVMDGDLQEPPEAIPALVEQAANGFDVVHTRRLESAQGTVRRALGRIYFRLRDALNGTELGADHGTMSLVTRRVVDAFLTLNDRHREFLVMLGWLGFDQTTIDVEHAPRPEGESSYDLRKLVRAAADGLFFQTTVFLTWIVLAGFLVAAAGAALAVYELVVYLSSNTVPGYTSLAVLILFMSGAILVALGVTGLYVGKTFEQAKQRPVYVVQERVGEDGGRPT